MLKKNFFLLIVTSVALAMGGFAFLNHTEPAKKLPMLKFSDDERYTKEWQTVDSLENRGLYKSALGAVNQIFENAVEKKNTSQQVKSLMYQLKYSNYIDEEEQVLAIHKLEKIANKAEYPLKPIAHSITAQIYWDYYQQNRWKFQQRSNTSEFIPEDIRTWDLTKIVEKVNRHYLLSVEDENLLQRTFVDDFTEIIKEGKDNGTLRFTLYDFIAHRAIDHFMNTESGLIKPAYQFAINDDAYLRDYRGFAALKITSKDSSSNGYLALQLLQNLTQFHLNDTTPTSLIDVDLKRLNFVRNSSTNPEKETLYLKALEKLENEFSSHSPSAEVSHAIAAYYRNLGNSYNPKNGEENRWMIKKAMEICDQTMAKFPDTFNCFGSQQCKALKIEIMQKYFQTSVEDVNQPNTPFRLSLQHKNLDQLHFKVVKVNWMDFKKEERTRNQKEIIQKFAQKKAVKQWTVKLTNDGDYQNHRVELPVEGLPAGSYLIFTSANQNFAYEENGISYTQVWISDIAYHNRENTDGTLTFRLMHRQNGNPLSAAKAQLYIEEYDYNSRSYKYKKLGYFVTDKDGFFQTNSVKRYRNFIIHFSHKGQEFTTGSSFYQRRNYQNNNVYTQTFFFTDRAIYRPGQTVYFKGIKIKYNQDERTIVTNHNTTIYFYDVNGQVVEKLNLKTNEYGTFNGSFTAPQSGLNGQMRIQNEDGSHYFSVEEYKRPNFEVNFEPIEGAYRLNERVKTEGIAKAFSGAAIDGANVNYRVTRNASYPRWCYWYWRSWLPNSPSMEITNGETKTDENGNFSIDFKAIPDESIDEKYSPYFSYTISADVTDINGKTHSAETVVYVGYKALKLNTNIPSTLSVNQKPTFEINTINLSGEKTPAKGTITIYKLKNKERVMRKRLWAEAGQHSISKTEYLKRFPFDVYAGEDDLKNLKKERSVFKEQFDTKKTSELKISQLKSWKPGRYLIELTAKDAYGEEVKTVEQLIVFNENSSIMPTKELAWFNPMKTSGEPGEKAVIVIGSGSKIKVLQEIEHKGKVIDQRWITLNNEIKKIEIPIKEEHRGNFSLHFSTTKHGRGFTNTQTIYVPRTNKQLDVSFSTFRNKLLPGSEEEWTIKIKGKKGDQVAAEMVSTMYDASLDEFRVNPWNFNIYPTEYTRLTWRANDFGFATAYLSQHNWNERYYHPRRKYRTLKTFGYYMRNHYNNSLFYRSAGTFEVAADLMVMEENEAMEDAEVLDEVVMGNISVEKSTAPLITQQSNKERDKDYRKKEDQKSEFKNKGKQNLDNVKARSNFNETAFFFPSLRTDEEGNVNLKFTIPESLTKWNFRSFAHTKDLKYGFLNEEIITQKPLMVVPNLPRFFRENDQIRLSSKITNLSEKDVNNGTAQLKLFDALTMKPLEITFQNSFFSVEKGKSTQVSWEFNVPDNVQAITVRIVAAADEFSDGEEMPIPVLTNRMLVTESLPLPMKNAGTKTYKFKKLMNSKSSTLKHHKLTLEYTANPTWYAVQALPYMMEYPYECAEQTFSRYYANTIATNLVNSSPKIKQVFESWKIESPDAFLSNLEKNQELKSVLLTETPWVLQAKNESERKKRVGLLFDLKRMSREQQKALRKLQQMQVSNGAWAWFKGGPDNRYITQHIVTGLGHLDNLGVKSVREDRATWQMVKKAVRYLDTRIVEDYEYLKKHYPNTYKKEHHLGNIQVQYLYARSFFKNIPIAGKTKEAHTYYLDQAKKYWTKHNLYAEGMIALGLYRYEDTKMPKVILKSIKERAILNEEMGMYWKDFYSGHYWYQAPIEMQALMIEAFREITQDEDAVYELKVFLLKQKQSTDWKTTKATADACYALLLGGNDWLENDEMPTIQLGSKTVKPEKTQKGTGYFKTSWESEEVTTDMGKVTISKNNPGVSWGAVYWQYFEQLDKITPAETPLKLKKQLFLEKNSDQGPIITPITNENSLKIGNKIKVRVELRVDRNMEFVHLKDMRASGFEPINIISRYKWQDGLGYYESTGDAATNFFIDYLPKGTYVFEYPLRVTHQGNFSNGVSSIQCMYAPEFTAHSEGIRIDIID